jgi:2-methylisocitrate lyase-like PEP mutase family enzyme
VPQKNAPAERARRLRDLHRAPPMLVLANAWDVVSARLIEDAGFPAVATSSAGVAASIGYLDGRIPVDEMLGAVGRIVRAVNAPVSADLEDCYGASPDEVQAIIARAIDLGISGLNIEDAFRGTSTLVPIDEQSARIRAVHQAGAHRGVPIVINARTDVFLKQIGEPSARERLVIERAHAFRAAGADCVFVPGVTDPVVIRRLTAAIPGPVNILGLPGSPSLEELEHLGVARVSLGSGPMRGALGWLRQFVDHLRKDGRLEGLDIALPPADVKRLIGSGDRVIQ